MERTQPNDVGEGRDVLLDTPNLAAQARQMLGEIAERLETHRADRQFTTVQRLATIQATTMDPRLGRALRELAPEVTKPVTRGEYAARLRELLAPDEATLRALLITMADRLDNELPDDPMIERDRLSLTAELAGRDTALHNALLAHTVHVAPDATRSEYAQIIRDVADGLDLVARYAAAAQHCIDVARQVGVRHCDENPKWRAAERTADALWAKAQAAGHTTTALMAASKAARG